MLNLKIRETSPLSPDWMQRVNDLDRDEKSFNELRRQPVSLKNTRIEESRVILFDRNQPIRNGKPLQTTNSIFNINNFVSPNLYCCT